MSGSVIWPVIGPVEQRERRGPIVVDDQPASYVSALPVTSHLPYEALLDLAAAWTLVSQRHICDVPALRPEVSYEEVLLPDKTWIVSSGGGYLEWYGTVLSFAPAPDPLANENLVFYFAPSSTSTEVNTTRVKERLAAAGRAVDRIARTPDGATALYFFGTDLMPNQAHTRYAMIECGEDGIGVVLEDRAAGTMLSLEPETDEDVDQAIAAINGFLAE